MNSASAASPHGYHTDLGLLAVAAIWGVNFSVTKLVLAELGPLALNALRFPLALAALALVVFTIPGPRMPRRQDIGRIVALGLLGNVAYQLCFIYGLDWTRAGNASLLLSTTPVWTLLLSAASGHELPSARGVVGVGGTLVGMALVVLGGGLDVSLGSGTMRGDMIMVCASVLWAAYTVAGRTPVARYGALRVTTWALLVGTPVIVAMGIPSVARTDLGAVSTGAWAGVVYAGVLSIGVAYLLWYRGVRVLGNNRTAVYSNLVPVVGLFTAWVWLGERPSALQLGGALVILAGLTVARLDQSPGPSSASPSVTPSSLR
jgi:drug/metabolite transporter (DMT)-like permease